MLRSFCVVSFFILHSSIFICQAQNVQPRLGERITVSGGLAEVRAQNRAGVDLAQMTPDSLYKYMAAIDSLRGDGVRFDRRGVDSLVVSLIDKTSPTGDTLDARQLAQMIARRKALPLNPQTVRHFMDDPLFISRYIDGGVDTLVDKIPRYDQLSRRELRRIKRADSVRYNKFFRDSIPLSRTVAISLAVPGFVQFYNEDYWKIPVVWGGMAAGGDIYAWQNKEYKPLKRRYDDLMLRRVNIGDPNYEAYKAEMTDVQTQMIRHNTYRQMAMGFALASYMYGLVDGTMNHPGYANDVKKATTLAMVFPGAGQAYNRSYWKIPIVAGGAAVLMYCIDFNNRYYQRYKIAYNALTDGIDETVDEFEGRWDAQRLMNNKNIARRNRDLCIILTGLFYVIQVIDAHATAHMKTYDVSDDLARVSFEPMTDRFYSHRYGTAVNTFGFSLNMTF